MDFEQNLYFGIGELAYAIAKADGIIQEEERHKIHKIVVEEMENYSTQFDISEIIFQILAKDNKDFDSAYKGAFKALKLSSHLIDDEIEKLILRITQKIAASFPPITIEEAFMYSRVKEDLNLIRNSKKVSS